MRKQFLAIVVCVLVMSCTPNEPELQTDHDLTGNEITYALQSGSDFNVSGVAVFKEKTDGTTRIQITLDKTFQSGTFPVHLHPGDMQTDGAAVAALLTPINGSKAASVTDLVRLSDESAVTFEDLKKMEACLKIHLSAEGDGQNIVLAAGNIGSAVSNANAGGRTGISICGSN